MYLYGLVMNSQVVMVDVDLDLEWDALGCEACDIIITLHFCIYPHVGFLNVNPLSSNVETRNAQAILRMKLLPSGFAAVICLLLCV